MTQVDLENSLMETSRALRREMCWLGWCTLVRTPIKQEQLVRVRTLLEDLNRLATSWTRTTRDETLLTECRLFRKEIEETLAMIVVHPDGEEENHERN